MHNKTYHNFEFGKSSTPYVHCDGLTFDNGYLQMC